MSNETHRPPRTLIRSSMTGGMVLAHDDDCYGANDHLGSCPVHEPLPVPAPPTTGAQ